MALCCRVNDSVSAQGSQEHNLLTGDREVEEICPCVTGSKDPKSNQPQRKHFYFRPSHDPVAPPTEHGAFASRSS